MPRRYDSAAAKRRILSVCVRLFIEKGYRGTRMADIIHAADVSSSTFQNIFHSKDGVLMELVQFMFENQFALASSLTMGNTSPALLYAVETSIQLALAEINENLREIYVEAYTLPEPSAYIHRQTAVELQRLFSYESEKAECMFFHTHSAFLLLSALFCRRQCIGIYRTVLACRDGILQKPVCFLSFLAILRNHHINIVFA